MARVEVKMPELGNEVTEAQIDMWLKAVGDEVSSGDEIVAVTTPKVSFELEAPESGTIAEILVEEDSVVEVGTVLAIIET
jgi:2-oxoglutarate dehydrogenase E2 component (dihydrolipoamide succinyltransferase)